MVMAPATRFFASHVDEVGARDTLAAWSVVRMEATGSWKVRKEEAAAVRSTCVVVTHGRFWLFIIPVILQHPENVATQGLPALFGVAYVCWILEIPLNQSPDSEYCSTDTLMYDCDESPNCRLGTSMPFTTTVSPVLGRFPGPNPLLEYPSYERRHSDMMVNST